MASLIILGGLGGAAYWLTQYEPDQVTTPDNKINNEMYTPMLKDFQETGMVLSVSKPRDIMFSSLNEAYKPLSGPDQTPTRHVSDVFRSMAESLGLLESTGVPFFFKSPIAQISLATNEQSSPNVFQLTSWSANKGTDSLLNFPRPFFEFNNQTLYDNTIKNRWTTLGVNTDAGMPTETEGTVVLPDAGVISSEQNPWGPGGAMQRIFQNRLASRTHQKGTNLSSIAGPPRVPRS